MRKMSTGEFYYILDKLRDKTKYIYYHLMGEPLTHPDIAEFIKYAKEKGFKSIITTNGTLIKERAEELLNSGVYKINVSLHSFENGDNDSHSAYVRELAEFSKKAAERGILVIFRLWNKGFEDDRNRTAFDILREHISGEWVKDTRGIRIRNKIHLEWGERFEWPDIEGEIKGVNFHCYGLKDQFGILSDGTVVPCCLDSDGVINLGNIFKEDIESILNSERALKMTDAFKCGKASEELCKKCGYAQRFV